MKVAKTYPSVPLIKIGGMRDKEERVPLYGSIRMSITGASEDDGIYTTTQSKIQESLLENFVTINGKKVNGKPKKRVEKIFSSLLQYSNTEKELGFQLKSENVGYPTGGGLSSSAAGAAAAALSLYLSLQKICPETHLSIQKLSEIARRGSSSGIGSVIGGFSEVKTTETNAWGEKIGNRDLLPDLGIQVVLIKGGTQSDRIHRAMEKSRYLDSRIRFVNETIPKIKQALTEGNTEKVIWYTHEDTKNFHGALLDQGIITFESKTLSIFKEIEKMHKENKPVGCSIAGGPNVIVLTTEKYSQKITEELTNIVSEETIKTCKIADEPRWES